MAPAPWTNPQAVGPYDLMVVGGDALGVLAAEFACASGNACASGKRIALASDHPLGLDWIGSVARSSLALAAQRARGVRAASRWGWPAAAAGAFDFAAWRQATDRLAGREALRFSAERLQQRGVDVHLGPMTFQSPGSLRVAGQSLGFARALVAPHADWAPPTVPGLAALDYYTPDNLERLAYWPRHWAIVGSDAVACELAQTLAALGSTVDLVAPDGLLAGANLEIGGGAQIASTGGGREQAGGGQVEICGPASIASLVARRLEADGVRLWVDCTVAEAARTGAAKSLLMDRHGTRQIIVADEILVVTHRRLDIEWLRLDLAGMATDGSDIAADRFPGSAGGRIAAVPARELPDPLDREAVAALARLAADAGLGVNDRSTPVPAPRRLRFDPPIAWIGDCGSGSPAAIGSRGGERHWVDSRMPLSVDALWWNSDDAAKGDSPSSDVEGAVCELRLRVDSRRRRLMGAIVVGAEAQWLVGPLTQMIVDGPRGAEHSAARAELEWLARLIAGPGAGSRRRVGWWRWIWRAIDRRPGA